MANLYLKLMLKSYTQAKIHKFSQRVILLFCVKLLLGVMLNSNTETTQDAIISLFANFLNMERKICTQGFFNQKNFFS